MPEHGFAAITLLGYLLGYSVPWLGNNIDYATMVILGATLIPVGFEYWRHKKRRPEQPDTTPP